MIELNRSVKIIYAIFLLPLLISTCSPPKLNSRTRYINDNPGLTPEIKRAIREGDVIPGMNKEHVLASWASPILKGVEIEKNISYESWVYPDMKQSPYVNIYFNKDIVAKVMKLKYLPKYE